jgi:hypothetical protein
MEVISPLFLQSKLAAFVLMIVLVGSGGLAVAGLPNCFRVFLLLISVDVQSVISLTEGVYVDIC